MLQRNKIEKKVSVIILCAGEGKRIRKLTRHEPKPLLRTKFINNIPILQHSIHNVSKLGINHINIVIGYLGYKIKGFVQKFTEKNNEFQDKINLIDASPDYKKGPLFSFLAITKNNKVFNVDSTYVVIPGDTVFEFNLLEEIFTKILEIFSNSQENQLIFYRNIETIKLIEIKEYTLEKSQKYVSFVEIEKFNNEERVKKISKKNIEDIVDFDIITQVIPLFAFRYDFVKKIIKCEKKVSFQTLREIINYLIQRGEKVLAVNVKSKQSFYDIDSISDIKYAEYEIARKKKEGQ